MRAGTSDGIHGAVNVVQLLGEPILCLDCCVIRDSFQYLDHTGPGDRLSYRRPETEIL